MVNIVYFYMNFLRLHVIQKPLLLPFIMLLSLDTQANVFIKATLIVKFHMCKYDIPYALEKRVMADLSALITWSSKITWQTKNITFPLPQCVKLQNLV